MSGMRVKVSCAGTVSGGLFDMVEHRQRLVVSATSSESPVSTCCVAVLPDEAV